MGRITFDREAIRATHVSLVPGSGWPLPLPLAASIKRLRASPQGSFDSQTVDISDLPFSIPLTDRTTWPASRQILNQRIISRSSHQNRSRKIRQEGPSAYRNANGVLVSTHCASWSHRGSPRLSAWPFFWPAGPPSFPAIFRVRTSAARAVYCPDKASLLIFSILLRQFTMSPSPPRSGLLHGRFTSLIRHPCSSSPFCCDNSPCAEWH